MLPVNPVLLPASTNYPLLPNGPIVWLQQGETDRSTHKNELTTNNVRSKNPSLTIKTEQHKPPYGTIHCGQP